MSILNKLYQRINFENSPSKKTPLNEENLNKMDKAINDLDNRMIELNGTIEKTIENGKAEIAEAVKQVTDEAQEQSDSIVAKGQEVLDSIPAEYQATVEQVEKNTLAIFDLDRFKASAILQKASGRNIVINDSAKSGFAGMRTFGKSEQVKTTGAQLFDKDAATLRQEIHGDDGSTGTDPDYYVSDYIEVVAGASYYLKKGAAAYGVSNCFYDASKKFLSTVSLTQGVLTVPSNAKYLRFNGVISEIDVTMLNAGSEPLPYEPYTGNMPAPNPQYPQEIVSVGQKLAEGWQLANLPDIEEVEKRGIVWSCKNGAVTAKGTATGGNVSTQSIGLQYDYPIKAGEYYISGYAGDIGVYCMIAKADGTNEYINNDSFTLDGTETLCRIYCQVAENKTVDSTIYPMLNVGSEPKPFEPYTGGVKKAVDVPIDTGVYGALVMNFSDLSTNTANSFSCKGSRISYSNTDGTQRFVYTPKKSLPKGTYTLYFKNFESLNQKGRIGLKIGDATETTKTSGTRTVFTLTEDTVVRLRATTSNQTSIDTWSADVGIVYGDVALAECPTGENLWAEPQSLSFETPNGLPGIIVPDASLANYTYENGQMWCCDERDWVRGVDVKRIATVQLTSSLSLSVSSNAVGRYTWNTNRLLKGTTLLCTHFMGNAKKVETVNVVWNNIGSQFVFNTAFETLDEFKAFLDSNEVYISYAMDNPIETPIPEEELAAWRALHSNYPTTTILSDAEVEVEYVTDTKTYIDNQIAAIAAAMLAGSEV